jgi:hypothetical protein
VTLGRVQAELLARIDEATMQRLAAGLLAGHKIRLRPAGARGKQLLVPLDDPARQAEILRNGLGAEGFAKLCKAARLLLRREQLAAG